MDPDKVKREIDLCIKEMANALERGDDKEREELRAYLEYLLREFRVQDEDCCDIEYIG